MKKTFRVKLNLEGEKPGKIHRTDGIPTHCASFQVDYFTWEKSTKYNDYHGWMGYVRKGIIQESLKTYNPDNLVID